MPHILQQPVLRERESGFTPRPHTAPHFFMVHSHSSMEDLLLHPSGIYIEVGPREAMMAALNYAQVTPADISLSLTSASAYKLPLAHELTQFIEQHFGLHECLETCLQEALINAIVHGNLDINIQFSSVCGFYEYCDLISKRLSSEPYASRRVHLSITNGASHLKIAVRDEGCGFRLPPGPGAAPLPQGRGLFFIQSLADECWVDTAGSTLFMTFNHLSGL